MPVTYSETGSAMYSAEANQTIVNFGRELRRAPENIVTLFTVNPRPQFSVTKGSSFPGKDQGQRYKRLGSIPDPSFEISDALTNDGRAKMEPYAVDGRHKAMDMLNPQWIGPAINFDVQESSEDPSRGDNLVRRGLFFIVRPYDAINGNDQDEPNEEEIQGAERRLQSRYTALVQLYQRTNASNPGKLLEIMNDEMTDALNAGGVVTPYTQTLQQKMACPNCGDMVPLQAKFHRSSLGYDCIIDGKSGWDAAVAAGFKKLGEVPPEFREK